MLEIFDFELFISSMIWVNFFSIGVLCLISFLISSITPFTTLIRDRIFCFSSSVFEKPTSFSNCSLFWISVLSLSSADFFNLWILSSWDIFWLRSWVMSSICWRDVTTLLSNEFNDDVYFLETDFAFWNSFSLKRLILLISCFLAVSCFAADVSDTMKNSRIFRD